ncbi:hypothetical protein CEXT_759411 [Caerostris extrusa]|uniref:Uncharacterized protein n=1 Tax=Caerostris extrusa TaxID=172846 RepID=A0AAV4PKP5_CAEEX|nr:hypothetical protein CEXT_759411 [Caerostris extrusa]
MFECQRVTVLLMDHLHGSLPRITIALFSITSDADSTAWKEKEKKKLSSIINLDFPVHGTFACAGACPQRLPCVRVR